MYFTQVSLVVLARAMIVLLHPSKLLNVAFMGAQRNTTAVAISLALMAEKT